MNASKKIAAWRSGLLYLGGATIPAGTVFPAGLQRLCLSGATIPAGTVFTDGRGYSLYRAFLSSGNEIWWAGCRVFKSRAAALAHWGGDQYPDKARGAAFCASINATPLMEAAQ